MRVAARDFGIARLAQRGRMTQKIGDVVFMYVRRPEPCGEGVPEVVEVEITDSGLFDCPFETGHQLTALPSRSLGVKDKLVIDCVLPQVLEDFECPSG